MSTIVTRHPDRSLPRLLVVADSTVTGPLRLLAEHFSEARFVRQENFRPAEVAGFRPDYVLRLIAERSLFAVALDAPPPLDVRRHLADRFARASLHRADRESMVIFNELEVAPGTSDPELVVTGPDPYVVFRPVNLHEGTTALVRVAVESEREVALQLFYAAAGQPFSSERSARAGLATGHRDVYFEVPGRPGTTLRVDVEGDATRVTLRAFELAVEPK